MVDGAGEMLWYIQDAGWDGYESVAVSLSSNRSTADITVTYENGASDSTTVRILGNPDAIMAGEARTGMLLKLVGGPEDYGFDSVFGAEGEAMSAAAVDAAFSGDDA
jgi:hypothetical protein